MDVSREQQKEVYRTASCRRIFQQFENARLRKAKAILAVVKAHNLEVWPFPRNKLVRILQSLLREGIFEFDFKARSTFPELFKWPTPPLHKPDNTTALPVDTGVMGTISKNREDLLRQVERLMQSADYSDLIITSSSQDYKVHKAIVCPRSKVIATRCSASWRTEYGTTDMHQPITSMDLTEDDAQAVDCMIQFFYRSDYGFRIMDEDPSSVSDEASPMVQGSSMLHARVYALAEQYLVEGLKDLAVAKFKDSSSAQQLDPDDFLSAAEYVYGSTVETDRKMRDAVVKVFHRSPQCLDLDAGKETLRTVKDLAYDVLLYVREQGKQGGFKNWA